MKKIKTNYFYDFLLIFCLGLYILGGFVLRRLVSNTFKFVYIKYNFNIFLFVISLIFVTINLCIFFNRRRNKFRNQNKKKTKNNEWGRDFLIFFRIFYFFSMLIIFLSILNIIFSRNELDFKSVRKYNSFNKIVKEYSIDSFYSVSVIPSFYTGRQGKSFRIIIKLYGKENFSFMDFSNRKTMLELLQNIKKTKTFVIDKTDLRNFYLNNVIYWSSEDQKLFEEIFWN